MNVLRDLRVLGLIKADQGRFESSINLSPNASETQIVRSVREHLHDRLCQNRLVSRLMSDLKTEGSLELGKIANKLSVWCPYVTASPKTWKDYAHVLAQWMDLADLSTYKSGTLTFYEAAKELRQRDLDFRRVRRKETPIPQIQFSPVEGIALEIGTMILESRHPNWERFSKSTRLKSIAVLEDLGFISRIEDGYRISPEFHSLVTSNREARRLRFATAISKLPAFAEFLSILSTLSREGCSHLELGRRLRQAVQVTWKDGTATVNAKIMLDWARHLGLAPGVFAVSRRRRPVAQLDGGNAPNP